jgi:hypothetical protein
MDIPANIDFPVFEPSNKVVNQCIHTYALKYSVPELMLRVIRDVEGGKIGTLSRNKNTTTVDIGIMQINTINLPAIAKQFNGVGWPQLAYDACLNIEVAAWFLAKKIKARKGNLWEGVMDYNSKTPEVRIHYAFKIFEKYNEYSQKSLDGTLYDGTVNVSYDVD